MMSISTVFWILVIIFGVIGGMRGWAKEILVLFSMILALFINNLIVTFVPNVEAALQAQGPVPLFTIRATFFIIMAFFGYETPVVSAALGGKARREKLQDILLGVVMGLLNGYLIIGSLWYYLHQAGYQVPGVIPPNDPEVLRYITFLPPAVIGPPYIYFAIALAFVFVIVVFL